MKILKDKKIIITGANGGIGNEIVKLLANEGANLTLISFDEEILQKNCNKIRKKNGKTSYIVSDFSSIKGIKETAEIISEMDDIYMIIHLAGMMNFNSLGLQSFEDIEKLYNVNLLAPVMLTKALLPKMIKNKSGHIVNIGSIFGSIALPYYAIYSSSKAGLRGFSESLSRELEDSGVKVSYLAPRTVKTPINNGKAAEFNKRTKANVDEPKEIAAKIIKSIKNEKKFSYFGFPEKLFVKVNYLFPSIVSKAIKSQTAIAREILMND